MQKSSTLLMEAHNQWANRPQDQRFQTLEQLAASVQGRRLRSRSVDLDIPKIEAKADNAGRLVINGTITPCEPTHWAFSQLAQTAKAPAGYLRSLPQPLIINCLNHGIQKLADRDAVKFMTITSEDGETNTLQAVTSTTYGRIWDADAVSMVQRIVEKSGGKFSNPSAYAHKGDANGFKSIDITRTERAGLYASDRDVFMFMVDGGSRLEVGPRAKLNRGFMVWNSETGSKTFGLMTFLFNEVCGNHIIWGAQNVNKLLIRHTSGGPTRFDTDAMPALKAYVESSATTEEATIQRAVNKIVCEATTESLTEFLAKAGKFTKAEVNGALLFAKAEEGDCKTLWHVVQGLTAYARGFDYVDARVDLERRAGSLLNLVAEKALTV